MKFNKYLSFEVVTERAIAYDSPDHLNPLGTSRDNSINPRFNEKIYNLFSGVEKPLKILDMGCSGGGFVKSCIDDGCLAVGLEGSDYSKILKRAEWKTIPDKLFTADITCPFQVVIDNGGEKANMFFDLVTCWEVMEHIKEEDIKGVAENVKKHLLPHGLWIMSVSLADDFHNGVNLHQTVKPKTWWIDKFKSLGLKHIGRLEKYFAEQYVRGNRYLAKDSFHLILSPDEKQAPANPNYPMSAKFFDLWRGSKLHRIINRMVDI